MDYVIDVPRPPSVPVVGCTRRFPVRRIWCVGRNYAEHAREMGGDPTREEPFFFAKPADAIVPGGGAVAYPPASQDFQHEIELVVAIGRAGTRIAPADALGCVFGYAVGLDMTRRDLQGEAKKAGRPWELGKAFDQSAPLAAIRRADEIGHPSRGAIALAVNGQPRQQGDLADMIWSVAEIVCHLSRYLELRPGDLIFTGTPAGVGPVRPGDRLKGSIAGVGTLDVTIVGAESC